MIRWRYIFTRLLIIAIILTLLTLGLGPAAKYVTKQGLQQATGAKVEIGATSVSLFPPSIEYSDVRIADPRDGKEMKNAFQADKVQLTIDGNELLHRRWVATNGSITGIEIGVDREESGHFDPALDFSPPSPSDQGGSSVLGNLVRGISGQIGNQAEGMVDELEMTRRSKEIQTRWETDYRALVSRARDLEQQIRDIRDSARGIDNPLRDWAELDRTLAKASKAREDLLVVRQAIDTLPERLQNDLSAMDEAKRIDLAKVDRYIPGDLSKSSNFGVDLMTQAIKGELDNIRSYVETGRTLANYTVVAPENDRTRGVNFDLDRSSYRPDMLVRTCAISGIMRSDGNIYALSGDVKNLTPTPELLEEPTKATLTLEGPDVIEVEYVRDRRSGQEADIVTLDWPQTQTNGMRLGSERDANISVTGGERKLNVQIRIVGNQIKGRVKSEHTGVQLRLNVDPKHANIPAVVSLGRSLAAVDTVTADINFGGTWKRMDFDNVTTNLGQVLHSAAVDAIAMQSEAYRAQLAAKVNEVHLQETLKLRKWLTTRQSEARGLIASADKSIEEMSRKVIDEIGDADAYLGKLRSALGGRSLR